LTQRKDKQKAAAAVTTGPLIYLGPSFASGVLTQHTVFKEGKIPAHISKLVEADTDLQLLIVPVAEMNKVKAEMKIVGTPEHAVYARLKGV
jgi:hypothetical protein